MAGILFYPPVKVFLQLKIFDLSCNARAYSASLCCLFRAERARWTARKAIVVSSTLRSMETRLMRGTSTKKKEKKKKGEIEEKNKIKLFRRIKDFPTLCSLMAGFLIDAL